MKFNHTGNHIPTTAATTNTITTLLYSAFSNRILQCNVTLTEAAFPNCLHHINSSKYDGRWNLNLSMMEDGI